MAITISGSGIVEANLADNAVTLAKMAGGTDGEILTYDASGNPVAVSVGTDGQVLTSTGVGSPPAFETAAGGDNTPSFSVGQASDQGFSGATDTVVTLDTEHWDTDNAFSSNTFTVPSGEGGKYCFTYQARTRYLADHKAFTVKLQINGAVTNYGAHNKIRQSTPSGNVDADARGTTVVSLSAGDTVKLIINQDSSTYYTVYHYYTVFQGFKLIGV
jgi:hypothetical protein